MEENQKNCMELANRIYDLDAEVYDCVGSSLGRTFTGDRENTIRTLCALMLTKPDGHLLRSELALISNMARTVKDKKKRAQLMAEYDGFSSFSTGSEFFSHILRLSNGLQYHLTDEGFVRMI